MWLTGAYRRAAATAGRAAVDSGLEVSAPSSDQKKTSAQSAPDRELMTASGESLRLLSYYDSGDPQYAELTEAVIQCRLREYQLLGLINPDAKRDNIRGPHVEFLAVVDPETSKPVASLRKIHVTGATLDQLPSYQRFIEIDALHPDGWALLKAHARADRAVVEIAALWKHDTFGADVKVELYKAALQTSIQRDELYFMGIAQAEYGWLLRNYGKRVVHTLGDRIQVKGAPDAVRLRPVMIEPSTFCRDMLDEMTDAKAAGDRRKLFGRGTVLADFLIGFAWSALDNDTRARLEGVINGIC